MKGRPMTESGPVFQTPHSTEWHRRIAEDNTVLLTEVGSGLHGVTVGTDDDVDEMGVCIEPPDVILGITPGGQSRFEQYEFRTQPVGARSGKGDIDRNIYSLRKYARMASIGSPTVLMPMYAPEEKIRTIEAPGTQLRRDRDIFLSKQAGYRFKGYLDRQRQRFTGDLAQRTARPELVERYGYDTKYAYHALRLAIQGRELMTTGVITLPMTPQNREFLLDVRQGKYTKDDVIERLDGLTHKLMAETEAADLPEWPDYGRINGWLADLYRQWWER